jgi:hypothetical protein
MILKKVTTYSFGSEINDPPRKQTYYLFGVPVYTRIVNYKFFDNVTTSDKEQS